MKYLKDPPCVVRFFISKISKQNFLEYFVLQVLKKHKYVHYRIDHMKFLMHSNKDGSSIINTPFLERTLLIELKTSLRLLMCVSVLAE